jgi:effector-binding domain-containing protein
MASFSKQELNIAYLNYSGGQDSVDTVWNNLLSNFEDLGFRLRHGGAVLEKWLEQMRKDHFS